MTDAAAARRARADRAGGCAVSGRAETPARSRLFGAKVLARADDRRAQPPQRPRRRHDPARPGAAARGAGRDRAPRPAGSAGGADDHQRHQRQDDDGRHARVGPRTPPAASPVHNRAGSNMAWGVATALLEQRGERGAVRGRRGLAAAGRAALDPTLLVLGNLFRDQLDRYGELERLADEWAELIAAREGRTGLVLNADDPLMADLGRDGDLRRRDGRHVLRRSRTRARPLAELQHAFDAKHCRRCGPPTPTSGRSSATSATTPAPTAAPTARRPTSARPRSSCAASRARAFRVRTPEGEAGSSCRCRGSTTSTTRSRRSRQRCGSGVGLERSAPALARVRAAFGRVETIEVGDEPLSILLIKNPAGANEVLRTLLLEAERRGGPRSTSGSRSTTGSPTAATSPGSGTPTSSCSPARSGGSPARGTARRRDGAAPQVRGLAARADRGRRRDRRVARPRARRAPGGRLFALPTYTALIELRTLLARRGLASEFWR